MPKNTEQFRLRLTFFPRDRDMQTRPQMVGVGHLSIVCGRMALSPSQVMAEMECQEDVVMMPMLRSAITRRGRMAVFGLDRTCGSLKHG